MTNQEMREMLGATLAAQSKNARFRKKRLPDAHLASPVTAADLSRLEGHVARSGARVPPSFVQFLRITDGIRDYMQLQHLSIRSAQEIVESRRSDDQWDDFAPLHEFVIASGETGAFIAFDHSRTDLETGEMPVVWIDEEGDNTDFSDFEEFLQEQLAFQESVLHTNESDRKNLPDD